MKIVFKSVSYSYKNQESSLNVLKKLDVVLTKGSVTAVLGPSGCGKSTLLKIVAGIINNFDGSIIDINRNIDITTKDFSVGYVPQRSSLLPWLNIQENLALGCRLNAQNFDFQVKIKKLLVDFGLEDFANSYPNELSGGMQSRVSILRAIAFWPDFLVMDEPFSSIDITLKLKIYRLITHLVKVDNIGAIFVTHDLREAMLLSDKIIVLSDRPAKIIDEFSIFSSVEERINNSKEGLEEISNGISRIAKTFSNIHNNLND